MSRLLLEAACHPTNQFWTLTYEDASLPDVHAPGVPHVTDRNAAVAGQRGTLFKPDLQRFFKRYRKQFDAGVFRYFACGEYGEKRGRPHYHVLAFGANCSHEMLSRLWGHGAVHIGDVEHASIEYCIGYSLKYRQKQNDILDLRRQPEFAVMSRNPGIGSFALTEIRQMILATKPLSTGEYLIPDSFRLMGKDYPIPRYLVDELVEEGFLPPRKGLKQYVHEQEILSELLARSPSAQDEYRKIYPLLSANPADQQKLLEVMQQRLRNAESRYNLFGKRHETL